MGGLALCGGLVVMPEGARPADVLVEGETIEAVTAPAESHGDRRTVDVEGCVVLPGTIDAHVHVHLPYVRLDGHVVWSSDGFPQASTAAALGGTTTIIDFAMQDAGQDLLQPLSERLEFAAASTVDVALHCWIVDPSERALAQLAELVARGVPSFKAFMAYSQLGEPMDDGELYDLFDAVAAVPPSWSVDNCIYRGLPALYPRLVLRRGTTLVEDGRYVGPASGTGSFVAGART